VVFSLGLKCFLQSGETFGNILSVRLKTLRVYNTESVQTSSGGLGGSAGRVKEVHGGALLKQPRCLKHVSFCTGIRSSLHEDLLTFLHGWSLSMPSSSRDFETM